MSRIETISAGLINFEKVGHVGPQDVARRFLLNAGDILFSHINSLSMVGNVAIYSGGRPLLHGMNLLRIQPLPSIASEWLLYWLKSKNVRQEVESRAKPAINQASISTDSVRALPALIPPSFEQTQIARFLDHETARIDALIEEQQRLIELLKEKRQAVISHAVTKGLDPTVPMKDSGVEWLGEVPAHWGVVSMSRIFEIRAGGDLKTEFYSDVRTEFHKYPIFTNATSESAIYGYTSKSIFSGGTITVTGRGDVGYAIYRTEPYDAIIRLLVLRPMRDVHAKFYAYFINAVLTFSVGSSAISQLSAEQIAPYKVLLPPLSEQVEILALLDQATMAIDTLINEAHGVHFLASRTPLCSDLRRRHRQN